MPNSYQRGYAHVLHSAGIKLANDAALQRPAHLVSLEGYALGGAAGFGAGYAANEGLEYLQDRYAKDVPYADLVRQGLVGAIGLGATTWARDAHLANNGYSHIMRMKSTIDGSIHDEFTPTNLQHYKDTINEYVPGAKIASWLTDKIDPYLDAEQQEYLRLAGIAGTGAAAGVGLSHFSSKAGDSVHVLDGTPFGNMNIRPRMEARAGGLLHPDDVAAMEKYAPKNQQMRGALKTLSLHPGKTMLAGGVAGAGAALGIDAWRGRGDE